MDASKPAAAGSSQSTRARRHALAYAAALVAALACLSLAFASAAPALAASSSRQHTARLRAPLTRRAVLTARSARFRRAGISRVRASAAARPSIGGLTGEIAGTVTSFTTKDPIAGIDVCAFDEKALLFGGCAVTNAKGEYELDGVTPGEYVVEFFAPFNSSTLNYITEEDSALVLAGETTTADAALHTGGSISGKVSGAEGVEGIEVCALEPTTAFPERCAETNASGAYTIIGLETAKYDVEFAVSYESLLNYAPQYYNGKPTFEEAEPVAVKAEQAKSGIDASLSPGGQIKGTVTSASSHVGIEEVEVCTIREETVTFSERCTETGPTGTYDLTALASGDYEVGFFPSSEFAAQFLSEIPVAAGSITSPEDAELTPEGSPGVPVEIAPPLISGTPVQGKTLSVAHGAWTNEPTSYEDEWLRCSKPSEILSCEPLVLGAAYTLTSADVGSYIRVAEWAENLHGPGLPALSLATAPITALPVPPRTEVVLPGAPLAAAPAPPAPLPGGGVLSSVTAHLSAAQISSLLLEMLVPSGGNAKIGALLKHGGYTATLDVPVSGQAEVSWSAPPAGARGASARPLLLAVGNVSFSGHGVAKLTIKLTAHGKSLLRHANRLKVTAHATLTPSGVAAASATKSFTLKR